MIAQALAEWRLWKRLYLRRSLPAFLAFVALACLPSLFRPFLLVTGLGLLFLGLGWHYGNRWQPGSSFRRVAEGRAATDIVRGRCLAALATWSLHLLLVAPALCLSCSALALPLGLIAAWSLIWLSAFLLAMALGFLSSLILGTTDHLVGAYVLAAWILPGLAWPPARILNPLAQAWSLARGASAPPLIAATLLELLAAGVLLLAARRRIEGETKETHAA